ncbi:MAG: GNAT family N-acetyltransferase [Clostridia bacterium]|nr:GNAT family N-acetyltransferase [Clostridia bacterium]
MQEQKQETQLCGETGNEIKIRAASTDDIPQINRLLYQVANVHAAGRPDLFCAGEKKYSDEELYHIIEKEAAVRPIFVCTEVKTGEETDAEHTILGYAFCMLEDHAMSHVLTPIRTLYIDDICVEETCRGRHIGSALYEYVRAYAKEIGCYNLTLNVWACNPGAEAFYRRMGMQVQKTGMETIL